MAIGQKSSVGGTEPTAGATHLEGVSDQLRDKLAMLKKKNDELVKKFQMYDRWPNYDAAEANAWREEAAAQLNKLRVSLVNRTDVYNVNEQARINAAYGAAIAWVSPRGEWWIWHWQEQPQRASWLIAGRIQKVSVVATPTDGEGTWNVQFQLDWARASSTALSIRESEMLAYKQMAAGGKQSIESEGIEDISSEE